MVRKCYSRTSKLWMYMKLFSLLAVSIVLSVSSARGAFYTPHPVFDSALDKSKKLHVIYLRLMAAKEPGQQQYYQRQFFNEFPNSFWLLNRLYGTTNGRPGYLADVAEKHIMDVFNTISVINDTLYCSKVISLASDGVWDTYGVNYFQTGLKNRMLRNPDLIFYLVAKLPPRKMRSFWHFYFDGLYPEREIPNFMKEEASENQTVYNLMTEAHTQVVRERETDDNPTGDK
jgi:hypothetical protein